MKKISKEKQNGITLISIVVTIVVLLILAGITIGVLTGENGLIKNTNQAKEQTEIEKEKEILETSIIQAMGENRYGDLEKQNLETNLKKNDGEGKTEVIESGDKLVVKFIESNRYYEIDVDGNVAEPQTIIADKNAGDISKGGELDGSEERPFEINCIEDLVTFSIMSNGGDESLNISSTNFENQYIILTRTLDFTSIFSYNDFTTKKYGDLNKDGTVENIKTELTKKDDNCIGFTPIGTFSGNFDGNGNQICNLYENGEDSEVALFREIWGATIENLGVIDSTLKSNSNIAGIVGMANTSTIKKCYTNLEIISTETLNRSIGGIIANQQGGVTEECYHIGNIIAPGSIVGGVLGRASWSSSIVRNCYNIGNISGRISGGVSGGRNYTDCFNCYSIGTITKTYLGGVIDGMNYGGHIVHCFGLRGDFGTLPEGKLEEATIISYLSQYNNNNYGHTENMVVGYECNILTKEKMQSQDFVDELNILIEAGVTTDDEGVITSKNQDVWKKDENNINNGYPIFNWQ